MIDKHIEAAAAAIFSEEFQDYPLTFGRAKDMAQAAITAYCESLVSAGEDGVVEAMRFAHSEYEDHKHGMRAALAVARASMAEDTARLDWIADNSKCYWVEVQSQPRGEYVYRGGGYGLRDALDEVISAARAAEGGGHE